MKLSPSTRMKLAHKLAKRDSVLLGTSACESRGIKTYRDLLVIALKSVDAELERITSNMLSEYDLILDYTHKVSEEKRWASDERSAIWHKKEHAERANALQERLDRVTARFTALRDIYVAAYGEATEQDIQRLKEVLPRGERIDGFSFVFSNLRSDGHHLLAVMAVWQEQYEYTAPCCCCGSKYGCDCGCTCEGYYGDNHYNQCGCDCEDGNDY